MQVKTYLFSVTGTFHGAIIEAQSEGKARKAFHEKYNGESITHLIKR
jgi:hypothetical protein